MALARVRLHADGKAYRTWPPRCTAVHQVGGGHDVVVSSMRPSETQRGRAWLTNFADIERPTARLLLDSLQVENPAKLHHGLKSRIDALTPSLKGHTGVLIPVLSIEDIDRFFEGADPATRPARRPWLVRHVAYDTFHPGPPIPATPGSEAAVGNLIRDLTGDHPGREPGQWLHPATDIDTLHARRCRRIVLVTDYTSSGQQVNQFAATFPRNARLRSWRSFGWLRIVVVTYAASAAARTAVQTGPNTDDLLVYTPAASFDDAAWTVEERDAIEALCKRHTPRRQRSEALGYGSSGGLFLTHISVPNNLPFILRRQTSGWQPFLEGRTVPGDLAAELSHYQAPSRNLADVVRAAHQTRLGRAIDSGRLRTPADKLVAVLALIANGSQTPATLTHRLALPDEETAAMLDFLMDVGFISDELTITPRGHNELRHARRLDRVATAHLRGKSDPYYPRTLGEESGWRT